VVEVSADEMVRSLVVGDRFVAAARAGVVAGGVRSAFVVLRAGFRVCFADLECVVLDPVGLAWPVPAELSAAGFVSLAFGADACRAWRLVISATGRSISRVLAGLPSPEGSV